MAETFLSPVIEKLLDLLIEETKSLKGLHKDVKSLQKELEIMEPFLRDAEAKSCRGELNEASKVWLRQLREESERIEDVVDEYLYHVEQHRHRRGFVGSLRKAGHSIKALSSRHDIASEIRDIKESLCEIKDRGQSYGLRPFEQRGGGASGNAATVDPRIGSLFVDDDELVGIDSVSNELVRGLVEGPSIRTVISLVGEGGTGKTTLAKKVYSDVSAKGHFDCHVWITVSQSCNVEMVLKMMRNHICPEPQQSSAEIVTIEELVDLLRDALKAKRYVVVFDDVWKTSFWGVIKHALPSNERGSRIVLTTRNVSVVESFKESSFDVVQELKTWTTEHAWELFCKKTFCFELERFCCPPELEGLSHKILSKCQGLPLAIVAVAGMLSKKRKTKVEWEKVLDNLCLDFEENSELSSISKVLLLSYYDLPYHLKLCFLYFGIFPEDFSIFATRLYNLWIAEGFIKSKRDNISLEQVAEGYLNELINRNLVLCDFQFGPEKSCKVHDLVHEIIVKSSNDLCFCQICIEDKLTFPGRSRRLIHYGNIENALKSVGDSKIRSAFLFNTDEPTSSLLITFFEKFKFLKVLDFQDAPIQSLPKEVGGLFHLKFLDLSGTRVKMLPKSIGKLINLQTLTVCNTLVRELPTEINKLRNLRHLFANSIDEEINDFKLHAFCGVKIHEGIGNLEQLQSLSRVDAYPSGAGVMEELHKLRNLRCLEITKVTAEMGKALGNAIDNMNRLDQLYLSGINEDEVLDLECITSPPLLIQVVQLCCRLRKLPSWIPELHNLHGLELNFSRLSEEPLRCLKGLPNLAFLLLYRAYDGKELHFEEGGFQKLKHLRINKLEELQVLKIDRGALPRLEKLEFGPSLLIKETPSDIQYLRNLKTFEINDMPREFVMALQPDMGTENWKIEHIPSVTFLYNNIGVGMSYDWYNIGSSELFEYLQVQLN